MGQTGKPSRSVSCLLVLTVHLQTKSGYKTRRTHNINKWVITPRVRNMGKRRNKKL